MPKRGGLYGKKRLAKIIHQKGFKYFAKLDIRHFFNSVRLEMVLKELETFVNDEWFIYLIQVIFEQFKKGLPLGFYISQWLANFVLCRIDWMILNTHPVCYVRYMDDYVIAANNKKYLRNLVTKIARALGRVKLRLKSNHQIIRFDYTTMQGKRIGRPIDFMGFKFTRERVVLRRGIMLKATRLASRLKNREIIAEHQAQSMLSRLGWFAHTDTSKLYSRRIRRNISIKSLKGIVSREQMKKERTKYDYRMARRAHRAVPIPV
jgi:hypothetical protein